MKFCNATKLSSLLTEITEPQKQIISYITSLKERGLSYNSVSLPLYAIYHFYEMNDVPLNKKKINMFKGEFLRRVSDRAYINSMANAVWKDIINYDYAIRELEI